MHVNWATNVPPMHAFVYHITQYAVKAIPKNNRNPEQQRAKVLKEVGVLKEVEVGVTGAAAPIMPCPFCPGPTHGFRVN